MLTGGADSSWLAFCVFLLGLRRAFVGVWRNCVWLVNSLSSSAVRLRTGLVFRGFGRCAGAALPSVGVKTLLLAAVALIAIAAAPCGFSAIASGATLFAVVVSSGGDGEGDGDGGVGRWHGRLDMCWLSGGSGCVRRDGGVDGEEDAIVDDPVVLYFSVAKSDC